MARFATPIFPQERQQAEALGGRLRAARLRRRVSLKDLATRVGVSVNTQRHLERGDSTVNLAVLIRTLTVLGLAPDLDHIAEIDEIGHRLTDAGLPRPRRRSPRVVS